MLPASHFRELVASDDLRLLSEMQVCRLDLPCTPAARLLHTSADSLASL